jgi:dTDP-4-dehydrorhamnose reductase
MAEQQHPWLVVGADGAIGGELLRRSPPGAIGTTRRAGGSGLFLDLAADPASWRIPDRVAVGFLCAAVTSVDRCRQFPAETRVVNVERTLRLAGRLRNRGAHVVFLSTNQVFDGTKPRPPHDAPTNPQTEYGRQKAEVERKLLAAGGATVVRFTKVVGPGMKLLHVWADALRRGEPVEPFADMVMSPVPLAFAAEALVRVGKRKPGGMVQVSGEIDVSYAEIARRLAEWRGWNPSPTPPRVGEGLSPLSLAGKGDGGLGPFASRQLVRPVSFASSGLPPEMAPPHTTLDTTRLTAELGLTPPPVWDTIHAHFEGLFHE